MIGNWFKRRIELAGARAATEDLQRFIVSLQGQPDSELGMLIAIATLLRLNFRDKGYLPDQSIGIGLPMNEKDHSKIQLGIAQFVTGFQKAGKPSDAAGTMVWLHTLRAFGYPEVRLQGRLMWAELQRGFPFAAESFDQIEALTGKPISAAAKSNYNFVPPGLEPDAV